MLRVLLVGIEAPGQQTVSTVLAHHGFEVVVATAVANALTVLRQRDFDLVLCAELDTTDLVRLAGPAAVGLFSSAPLRSDDLADRGLAFCVTTPVRTEHLLAKVSDAVNVAPVTDARRAAIGGYFSSIERGDWEGLAATCTEDVLYHLPSDDPRFGRTVGGRAAFRDFAAHTFGEFREPRFELDSVRSLPRGASVRYRGLWLAADGSRPSVPGAVLFLFKGDLISEIGVRLDVAALHAR